MQLFISIFFLISLIGSSFFLYVEKFYTFHRIFNFTSQSADIGFIQIFNRKNVHSIVNDVYSSLDPIGQLNLQLKSTDPKGDSSLQTENISHHSRELNIHLPVEHYQLPNGLTVLLHSDTRIPYIHHFLIVKVGSVNEVEGKTGVAHLFEHMMFRGTKRFSGDEYEKKLNTVGAINNAFTNWDMTGYYVYFPKQYLEMILDMESDRLQNLVITKNIFEKELEVVKEERRMRIDNDPGDIFEPMMKLVYPAHPYGRPVIGWMKDLEAMTVPDLKRFYQAHYAPNNIILVLAGDFNNKKAKKLIQKYYGPLRRSRINPLNTRAQGVSSQKKVKHFVKYQRAIQGSTIAFGFRAPAANGDGSYDLDIASQVLTGGQSSRLKKLLIYEKRLAMSVNSFYHGMKGKGIFMIIVRLIPGASVESVKQLVFKEINKLSSQEVSDKELLKSQRSVLHFFISSIKNLSGKSSSLGEHEMLLGDYKEFFKQLDYYSGVTVQSIQKHVTQYLQKQQAFIVQLVPMQEPIKGATKAL